MSQYVGICLKRLRQDAPGVRIGVTEPWVKSVPFYAVWHRQCTWSFHKRHLDPVDMAEEFAKPTFSPRKWFFRFLERPWNFLRLWRFSWCCRIQWFKSNMSQSMPAGETRKQKIRTERMFIKSLLQFSTIHGLFIEWRGDHRALSIRFAFLMC